MVVADGVGDAVRLGVTDGPTPVTDAVMLVGCGEVRGFVVALPVVWPLQSISTRNGDGTLNTALVSVTVLTPSTATNCAVTLVAGMVCPPPTLP